MHEKDIRDAFSYHAPTERKVSEFEAIRERMTETGGGHRRPAPQQPGAIDVHHSLPAGADDGERGHRHPRASRRAGRRLMASAATRTLLDADVWASSAEGTANRQTPEALGIVRTVGYDLKYQQRDSASTEPPADEPAVSRVGSGVPSQDAPRHPGVG